MNCPPYSAILQALREGYGVEDIAADGIASADEARAVIANMRKDGTLWRVVMEGRIAVRQHSLAVGAR